MIIKIPNRSFIGITGSDRKSFLQGITTINIDNISDKFGGWGAVLSPQGKFQYGFFIFEYNHILYLETTTDNLMKFGELLSKYILSSQLEFSIQQNITVYSDTKITDSAGKITINANKLILNDPRTTLMGTRIYVFNNAKLNETGSIEDYETIRIKNTVVDLETDGLFNATYALELNMDKLNGVDFNKGCFVGQEVTARMHYKGGAKKNIYTIQAKNPLTIGAKIVDATNRQVGTITSTVDNIGLAILRNQFINGELFVANDKIIILNK